MDVKITDKINLWADKRLVYGAERLFIKKTVERQLERAEEAARNFRSDVEEIRHRMSGAPSCSGAALKAAEAWLTTDSAFEAIYDRLMKALMAEYVKVA